MNYNRVIPRDIFNESKLLKCIGKIVLLIHERQIDGLSFDEDCCADGFVIEQDESDGSIYVANLPFRDASGEPVHFSTGLNSKENWPLRMIYRGEEYYPLSKEGDYQLASSLFTS